MALDFTFINDYIAVRALTAAEDEPAKKSVFAATNDSNSLGLVIAPKDHAYFNRKVIYADKYQKVLLAGQELKVMKVENLIAVELAGKP